MPFYEYQCKNCGHELEAMQKVSDTPLKKCPHCGKSQLQRLMSAPVFRLKGAGWYETDFKDDKDKKRNLADRPEADGPKVADGKDKEVKTADAKATETAPADAAKTKEQPAAKADKASPPAATTNKPPAKKAARGRMKRLPKKAAARGKSRR
jgi:putative FmdB family regulatory protein